MTPTVWILPTALDDIVAEAIRMAPDETGGLLMGYGDAENGFVVTATVGPGPDAVHAPYRFVPDHAYQEREVARHYRASGRTETYLGDWHSHPTAGAYLSPRDRKTLRSIARDPDARAPTPLMMVVAGKPEGLGLWYLAPHRVPWFRKPQQCSLSSLAPSNPYADL